MTVQTPLKLSELIEELTKIQKQNDKDIDVYIGAMSNDGPIILACDKPKLTHGTSRNLSVPRVLLRGKGRL